MKVIGIVRIKSPISLDVSSRLNYKSKFNKTVSSPQYNETKGNRPGEKFEIHIVRK